MSILPRAGRAAVAGSPRMADGLAGREGNRGRRGSGMTRALVLGGGGPVGIAWQCGLIAGLAQGGVDLGQADFTLGTSAGSFVGLRLAMGEGAATLADAIFADAERSVRNVHRSSRRPPDL